MRKKFRKTKEKKKDSKALAPKVKEKEKNRRCSFQKVVKKKIHFATKGDIQRVLLLKQSFYLLLSWKDGQERGFQSLPYSNIPNITSTYVLILFTGVEERIPEFQEPLDLRSNPF